MAIIMADILAPTFLVNNIETIAIIIGAVLLVVFSSFVNKKIIFPIADVVREETHKNVHKLTEHKTFSDLLSDWLATIIFLLYCYLGASLLARYIFTPILIEAQSVILLIVIVLFLMLSFALHNKKFRKSFF